MRSTMREIVRRCELRNAEVVLAGETLRCSARVSDRPARRSRGLGVRVRVLGARDAESAARSPSSAVLAVHVSSTKRVLR